MRRGILLAIAILAHSMIAPAQASITYDVFFKVDASLDTALGQVTAPGTVDVKLTSDGPATQTSVIITIPFVVSSVSATTSNELVNALLPFAEGYFSNLLSGAGGSFTYDPSNNKISLGDQFTFLTTDSISIVGPFATSGTEASFNQANFTVTNIGEGSVKLVGDIQFSATGNIDLSIAAVPGPIVGAGLPGLLMALGGLIILSRRRHNQAAVA